MGKRSPFLLGRAPPPPPGTWSLQRRGTLAGTCVMVTSERSQSPQALGWARSVLRIGDRAAGGASAASPQGGGSLPAGPLLVIPGPGLPPIGAPVLLVGGPAWGVVSPGSPLQRPWVPDSKMVGA